MPRNRPRDIRRRHERSEHQRCEGRANSGPLLPSAVSGIVRFWIWFFF
jgi:hypothetical protein